MAITSANQLELLQTAEAVAREKMIDPGLVVAAMEESLARIAAINPKINAIVALRDEAALMDEARAMDAAPLFRRFFQRVFYGGKALILVGNSACVDAASSRLETLLPDQEYFGVELHRISTGHHWLRASLNGESGYFILDTWAGATGSASG